MKQIISLTLLVTVLTTVVTAQTSSQCTLEGEVLERTSKFLVIRKCTESPKVVYENPVKIPIHKGRFNYTFSFKETEAYELIFKDELEKGGWKAIPFFPINGTIKLKLYPMDKWDDNIVEGGELNAEYASHKKMYKELFGKRREEVARLTTELQDRDEFETAEYKTTTQMLKATKSDDYDAKVPIYQKRDEMEKTRERYTEKAKLLVMQPLDTLTNDELEWNYTYIRKSQSLAAYYLIWHDVLMTISRSRLALALVVDVFPLFAAKYPNHVYTTKIKAQLAGFSAIAPGNKFIDFKAPTVKGDTVKISDAVKDHVALIDLWGSWCGPCIAKSRFVVPIYNRYKDRGFTVIGVAREFKNANALSRTLDKEKFPWMNLIELDDKLNIWNKYGISNGSGLMVLIDKTGTILAVDPKPEELEKILQEKL
jgi:peroxiredoxin